MSNTINNNLNVGQIGFISYSESMFTKSLPIPGQCRILIEDIAKELGLPMFKKFKFDNVKAIEKSWVVENLPVLKEHLPEYLVEWLEALINESIDDVVEIKEVEVMNTTLMVTWELWSEIRDIYPDIYDWLNNTYSYEDGVELQFRTHNDRGRKLGKFLARRKAGTPELEAVKKKLMDLCSNFTAKKYYLVLSRRPSDFLMCSNNKGWRSCYATFGCYAESPMWSWMQGGYIAYFVDVNKDQWAGRVFVRKGFSGKFWVEPRAYVVSYSLFDSILKETREFVSNKLGLDEYQGSYARPFQGYSDYYSNYYSTEDGEDEPPIDNEFDAGWDD